MSYDYNTASNVIEEYLDKVKGLGPMEYCRACDCMECALDIYATSITAGYTATLRYWGYIEGIAHAFNLDYAKINLVIADAYRKARNAYEVMNDEE